MKKRFYSIIVLIAMISSMVVINGCWSKGSGIINIGAILPLSGDLSSYGVDTRKALELAVEEINTSGRLGDKKLNLIVEDSQGLTKQAVIACNKLIEVDKVWGILGPITSPEVLSVSPIVNKKKIPIISPSSTSVDISEAGDYVFRTINADNIESLAMAKFVKENYDCMNMGVIANQAAGTLSYADSFEKEYIRLGCKVNSKEIVQENLNDFKTPINKLLSKDIEGIYIAGYSKEIGIIIRQIREYNKEIALFSYQSAEDPRVVEVAKESVDGLIYSTTTLPDEYLGKPKQDFIEDFANKFNKKPGIFSSEIFDAINIMISSLLRTNFNRDDFIQVLRGTNNYRGASGNISFDKNGDVNKPIAIAKYKGSLTEPLFVIDQGKITQIDR